MGGETRTDRCRCSTPTGLSPRGRGNPRRACARRPGWRSIPAWAGKPLQAGKKGSATVVYPRVGGETSRRCWTFSITSGLSPRGRGNRSQVRLDGTQARSIPAWAGKPLSTRRTCRAFAVYPRVGGETGTMAAYTPRRMGLSPRGRGNRGRHGRSRCRLRSIPAWAGKPSGSIMGRVLHKVYPRVGGETAGDG